MDPFGVLVKTDDKLTTHTLNFQSINPPKGPKYLYSRM